MIKHLKKILCIIMCLGIIFLFPSEPAGAVTNDSIKEKEAEIDAAKREVDKLKSSMTDVEAVKKELEKSKSNLTEYVTQLDTQLSNIQTKIDEYKTLITDKTTEIEETTAELDAAVLRQEEQYEEMKARIKFMYECGDTMYLEMLFSSDNFVDLMNKADYIEALSAYDRAQLDEYISNTELIALCKEELEVEKAMLEEAKLAVEDEETAVNTLIAEKETQLKTVTADISTKAEAIKAYEADIAAENETIKALEKAVAEEKARLAAENAKARVYDGGMFSWPCPAYKRISDDFGYRTDPYTGAQKMHNGIDLAAPYGSVIYAAYDGDVVAATYSSSMGNYIMIDHGDGLYTIYMHASALYVSKGQSVYKGQSIAAVGSTGRSTGNHLHFSVRLNGEYVNPWNYLK
ncbi:MAG: peptidoglycan DD-metalloendopeptidase family protein [Butyrivibrio sp.]|nr:peptidoglycan DD-metalloendopeptidase family protein [Butyrivibrio sp.]